MIKQIMKWDKFLLRNLNDYELIIESLNVVNSILWSLSKEISNIFV